MDVVAVVGLGYVGLPLALDFGGGEIEPDSSLFFSKLYSQR